MKSAIKNSILSFIIGDIIGVPFEFIPRKYMKLHLIDDMQSGGTHNMPIGSWSDDTSMTLCTIESLIEYKKINIENLCYLFSQWAFENYMTPTGKVFDIGMTTIKALGNYKKGIMPSGLKSIDSNGNGSLMRILPISIFSYYMNLSELEIFKYIKEVSAITHAHPISILGCYIYTLVVHNILNNCDKENIFTNLNNLYYNEIIPNDYKEFLNIYEDIINGRIINKNANEIETTGYIKNTLEAAIWSFYNTNSTEECILKLVNLGWDTDTNAAVGGSLSGLYYGIRRKYIKQEWIDKILQKKLILNLTDKYLNLLF